MNQAICDVCEDAHRKDKSGCEICMNFKSMDYHERLETELKKMFFWMVVDSYFLIVVYIIFIAILAFLMYLVWRQP